MVRILKNLVSCVKNFKGNKACRMSVFRLRVAAKMLLTALGFVTASHIA